MKIEKWNTDVVAIGRRAGIEVRQVPVSIPGFVSDEYEVEAGGLDVVALAVSALGYTLVSVSPGVIMVQNKDHIIFLCEPGDEP